MLGREIADPAGIEGPPGAAPGLGLLDVCTELAGPKRLATVAGRTQDGQPFAGYEMHMGRTEGPDRARPFAALADGRIVALGPMETMLECTHPWVQTYFQGKRGGMLTKRIGQLVD